ncbi:MAG: response regulator [Planctomycetes bacterium]|nr:response regulator [Planctomycetota bacterium]
MTSRNDRKANWAEKKVFTTGEAAEICNVSLQTIIRCFDTGRLQGFRVPGSKFRRIPRSELIRFLESNSIPTDVLESPTRRVLIVDDDPDVLELLTDLLGSDERFDVATAVNGYEAGLLTERLRPHLILLDCCLPDLDGAVLCRRIREGEEHRGTRVLLMSGVVDEAEIRKLGECGPDGFIRKPLDASRLLEHVEDLLRL